MATLGNNLKTPTWMLDTIGKYDPKGCSRRVGVCARMLSGMCSGVEEGESPVKRNGHGNNPCEDKEAAGIKIFESLDDNSAHRMPAMVRLLFCTSPPRSTHDSNRGSEITFRVPLRYHVRFVEAVALIADVLGRERERHHVAAHRSISCTWDEMSEKACSIETRTLPLYKSYFIDLDSPWLTRETLWNINRENNFLQKTK